MRHFNLSAIVALVWLANRTAAQLRPGFQWGWGDIGSQKSFEECQTLSVVIESLDAKDASALGVAPYYMLAFEAGGVSTTSMIGFDPKNLWWQANHKRGSSLMLTIVDSNGSTGGVPQPLYGVTAGSNTSCLQPAPLSPAVVHANVSDTISTCDPLGLTVTGGQKPYTIVLAETHSNTITTVTLSEDDDTLTYISRVDPDWQLIASVYDASGHWGTSTNAIRTSGIQNTSCVGLWSTQSNSANGSKGDFLSSSTRAFPSGTSVPSPTSPLAGPTDSSPAPNRHKLVAIAVGVTLGVGIPLLLAAVLSVWLWLRRSRHNDESHVSEFSRSKVPQTDLLGDPISPVDPATPAARITPYKVFTTRSSPSHPERGHNDSSSSRSPGAQVPDLTPKAGAESSGPNPARTTPSSTPRSEKSRLQLANEGDQTASSSSGSPVQANDETEVSQRTLSYQPSTPGSAASHMDSDEQGSQELLLQPHNADVMVTQDLPPAYDDLSRPPTSVFQHNRLE